MERDDKILGLHREIVTITQELRDRVTDVKEKVQKQRLHDRFDAGSAKSQSRNPGRVKRCEGEKRTRTDASQNRCYRVGRAQQIRGHQGGHKGARHRNR